MWPPDPFLPLTPPYFPTEGRKAEREITGSVEASWKLFLAGSSFSDLGFPLPPLIMMLNWTRPQEQPVALCQDTQQGPLGCCDWWTSLGDAQNAVLPEAAASHRKAVEMQARWSGARWFGGRQHGQHSQFERWLSPSVGAVCLHQGEWQCGKKVTHM